MRNGRHDERCTGLSVVMVQYLVVFDERKGNNAEVSTREVLRGHQLLELM